MKWLIIPVAFIFCITSAVNAQQAYEDSLNKVIAESKNDADVSRAYNALAYEYTRTDPAKTRYLLSMAIAFGKKANNPRRISNAYGQLMYVLYDAGQTDSAEYYLNLVKELADGAPEEEQLALNCNYNSMAAMFYKKAGSYQRAIPFFEQAISLFQKIGDKESTAGQTLNLGNTYTALGNYQKSTEQHLKALRLFEEVGSDRGISFCYQSLSNSFTQLKQYSQALTYAKKSIRLKTKLKDQRGIGTAESGLGEIYFGMGNFDEALRHYQTAATVAKTLQVKPDEQGNYLNMAKAYAAKKDIAKAIDYFNRSKSLAKELHDSSSVASIDAELIALQHNADETTNAEDQLKTSLQLFEERGDLNRRASGFKSMADFYAANKQFDKALEYTNKYYQALDSIHNNELQLQVLKMEEGYNSVKKENEITLLKKDKELQRQKLERRTLLLTGAAVLAVLALGGIWLLMNRNKLRQRMKELELRNRIAADLHDEVGSSLSSIHMLSQMAGKQSGRNEKEMEILTRMNVNAKETMEKMSDIVWMIKPGETEAGSLKQRMERFAYEISSSKNISTLVDVDELEKVKLSMEQRRNIYLVFKEAVNNAVKYSGTEKIEVRAFAKNKEIGLSIRDNGKGFDPGMISNGNGLGNMKNRANELKGNLEIESATGAGTTIILTVPV